MSTDREREALANKTALFALVFAGLKSLTPDTDDVIRDKALDILAGWMPRPAHNVVGATVRDGGDEWHIECRFADGQKFPAVKVDKEHEALADAIAAFLRAALRALTGGEKS